MDTIISCRVNRRGNHNFYVEHNGREYYLFTQDYHLGVDDFFSGGISLRNAMDFTLSHRDFYIQHTMEKLNPYIRYVEQENGISILERRRHDKRKKARCSFDREWLYEDMCLYDDEESFAC